MALHFYVSLCDVYRCMKVTKAGTKGEKVEIRGITHVYSKNIWV